MKIKISHLAKIEGHASFFADMLAGDIKNAKLKITIGARLIESIILNRNYIETPIVTSRICGICSVAHNITSIKAIENALGVKINPQIERLRKILVMAEPIQSHAAHLFFLSLSDFFKYESDVDLIKKYPNLAKQIILIRDFGNKIKDVIGGRDMHMISTEIGGFRGVLDDKIIKKLIDETEPVLEAAIGVAKFFRALDYPKYERKVEFAGLVAPREYAFYDGVIGSTVESARPVKKFYKELVEKQTSDDPTKRASHLGKSFMPGAIARLNLSHKFLNPEAKKFLSFFDKSSGKILTYNTFHNIFAQSVELVHCVEEVQKLLKEYLRDKSRNLMVRHTLKNGEGLAATEAPRGTLYHYYKID
ncbi:nickel-dependent hydrogenase large subunit, partial [Patescibacteria group bacterium]|nr:nickel-dependent hydrogenase large subunit [Patescibacteria group bacterium]